MGGLSPEKILARMREPLVRRPKDETRTFRLGLVLNGTVSAGAWMAGVLDGFVEALDTWEAAKAAGDQVPDHSVVIEVIGGASGGAVCGALLARAATRRFTHVKDAAGAADNPFWTVWIERLRIEAMLEHASLGDEAVPPASLLSGLAIDQAMEAILGWHGKPLVRPRAWLADPFHLLVTQTNLRGVPYEIDFRPDADGNRRISQFVAHADHRLFALPQAGAAAPDARGDELVVPPDFIGAAADWEALALHARASGAFPIGFPPVRLKRPRGDYDWRGVVRPAGGGKEAVPDLLVPAWPGHEDTYVYDAVDGGALNVSPFSLVHEAMAGLGNSLVRDPREADKTILVIDPFGASGVAAAPTEPLGLFGVAGQTVSALVAHGRFATSDLLLALDPEVGSRFLLTAGRRRKDATQVLGGSALATTGLSAFLGFVDGALSVHDYLLGRRNAFGWLDRHFTLPAENPVFGGFAARPGGPDYLRDGHLPIIPLVPPLRALPPQPDWPVPKAKLSHIEAKAADRLAALVRRLADLPCEELVADRIGDWAAAKGRGMIETGFRELAARA